MARYYGKIGYGLQQEIRPGVYENQIVERPHYGSVDQITKRDQQTETIHPDLTLTNIFNILVDAFALEHFHAIKYIEWQGSLWTVSSIELKRPRLIIRPGGVYNGPTA